MDCMWGSTAACQTSAVLAQSPFLAHTALFVQSFKSSLTALLSYKIKTGKNEKMLVLVIKSMDLFNVTS